MAFLKRFYRETYHRLRPILAGNQVIVFHDGFRLGRWRDWFVREGMRGVMLDTHVYLVMAEQFPLFRLIPDRWLMAGIACSCAGTTPHPPGRALYAGDCRGVVRG